MALTFSDREQLWIQGGGNPAFAPIAAAISMAENASGTLGANPDSGCDTSIPECANGCYAVGPWQIECSNVSNLIKQGVISSLQDLSDPVKNAAAAMFISGNGKNWSPWTTFKTGAYQAHLPNGVVPPSTTPPGSPTGQPGWIDWLNNVGKGTGDTIKKNTPAGWMDWASSAFSTTLVVGAGLVLIAVGGIWIALSNQDVRGAAEDAGKAALL